MGCSGCALIASMSEKAAKLIVEDGPSSFGKGLGKKELQWWSIQLAS